jgi:hypothetical protein
MAIGTDRWRERRRDRSVERTPPGEELGEEGTTGRDRGHATAARRDRGQATTARRDYGQG